MAVHGDISIGNIEGIKFYVDLGVDVFAENNVRAHTTRLNALSALRSCRSTDVMLTMQFGETAFTLCGKYDAVASMRYLCEIRPGVLSSLRTSTGNTPLMEALITGSSAIVKLMLELGAPVNVEKASDPVRNTLDECCNSADPFVLIF